MLLKPNEKWRISYNWKIGRFKKSLLLKQNVKYIPWLCLNKDLLWISEGLWVKAYRRTRNQSLSVAMPEFTLRGDSDQDVSKFLHKNGLLLCGARFIYVYFLFCKYCFDEYCLLIGWEVYGCTQRLRIECYSTYRTRTVVT